jgi:hypothetical protein
MTGMAPEAGFPAGVAEAAVPGRPNRLPAINAAAAAIAYLENVRLVCIVVYVSMSPDS